MPSSPTLATRSLAAALLAATLIAGCSQQDPAAKAIDAAEGALAAVHEDALKYIPEQYNEVKAQLDAARKAFESEEYGAALNAVKDVPARASALAEAAAAKKTEVLAQLSGDWMTLTASLPATVTAIEGKLAELGKLRKLPEGLDADGLADANGALTTAKATWEQATQAFTAGNVEEAVAKGREVQAAATALMGKLGMAPAAEAPATQT